MLVNCFILLFFCKNRLLLYFLADEFDKMKKLALKFSC